MILVDANVLIYSVNTGAPHHARARRWLETALTEEVVGFAWNALLAFVRISTGSAAMSRPLAVPEAMTIVDEWLAAPGTRVLAPGGRHAAILAELLDAAGRGGDLVQDAHLAALAIEHRAEVVTFDTDFARFPGVRWRQPA